jgi:hypothetical protein
MAKKTPDNPRLETVLEDSPNRESRTGGRTDGTEGLDGTSYAGSYLKEKNANVTKSSGKDSDALVHNAQRNVMETPLPEVQSPNKKGNRVGAQDL